MSNEMAKPGEKDQADAAEGVIQMMGEHSERTARAFERMADAAELQALAAWATTQHQKCNHAGCGNGAVRLRLAEDSTAVVPACAEHDRPKLDRNVKRAG